MVNYKMYKVCQHKQILKLPAFLLFKTYYCSQHFNYMKNQWRLTTNRTKQYKDASEGIKVKSEL